MKTDFDIIRRPLITEKNVNLKETQNQLSFEVARSANKHEIKKAIERVFGVTVLDVRTMNYKGKPKRLGLRFGRRPHWKKAIVTLKKGDYIEFFEGA